MKCPILTMYALTFETPDKYQDRDCLKEECAWWDEEVKACSARSIQQTLYAIERALNTIAQKLPPHIQEH